jgi:putative membrane protein
VISLLFATLVFRWYVFFFWGLGLWILSRAVGFRGALLRFLCGYGIAYFCEWSSARPGGWFPFGHYVYLPTTIHREIWIGHLPLMDSLSFDFLAVGALGVSAALSGSTLRRTFRLPVRSFLPVYLQAVVLFVMIDMVIDPVALRGEQWFLRRIYEYPYGGIYFGVTLSNFAGWAITGGLIMACWKILSVFPSLRTVDPETSWKPSLDFSGRSRKGKKSDETPGFEKRTTATEIPDRYGPLFVYAAVYLFNLSIAVYLRLWGLVLADLLLPVLFGTSTILLRWAWRRPSVQGVYAPRSRLRGLPRIDPS